MTFASPTGRITLREVRAYFASPVGWTTAASFFMIAGLIFVALLFRYRQAILSLAQSSQLQTGGIGLHVNDYVVRQYFTNIGSMFLFFVPLLTMRTLAEEKRSGSLELLLSFPLRGQDVLVGKFFGTATIFLLLLSVVPLHGLILASISTPDWSAALVGLLGLVLLGLFMLSLGILVSSLAQSQLEAGVVTLGLLLLLGLGPNVLEAVSPSLAHLFSFAAILTRYETFARGLLDLEHVAFFLGGTFLWLALALRSIDLLRWRGA